MSAQDNLHDKQFGRLPDVRLAEAEPNHVPFPNQLGLRGHIRTGIASIKSTFMTPQQSVDYAEEHGLNPVRVAYGKNTARAKASRDYGIGIDQLGSGKSRGWF